MSKIVFIGEARAALAPVGPHCLKGAVSLRGGFRAFSLHGRSLHLTRETARRLV